jgi:hypothetical protein
MTDYRARLDLAKVNNCCANCIGTALYLIGCVNADCHIEPEEFDGVYDSNLTRLTDPQAYCLALVFHSDTGKVLHAGVVTRVDPVLVTHRAGINGRIIEDDSLENFVGWRSAIICQGFFGCRPIN